MIPVNHKIPNSKCCSAINNNGTHCRKACFSDDVPFCASHLARWLREHDCQENTVFSGTCGE